MIVASSGRYPAVSGHDHDGSPQGGVSRVSGKRVAGHAPVRSGEMIVNSGGSDRAAQGGA